MLTIYRDENGSVRTIDEQLPRDVIWSDLLDPDDEERSFVETRAKLRIPSKDDLSKIDFQPRSG